MRIVIAQPAGSAKHYIFSVPEKHTLKNGDLVQVQTAKGITNAACVCNSFEAEEELIDTLLYTYGGKQPLPTVLGIYTYKSWTPTRALHR